MAGDVQFAFRTLRKSPGFAAVAILSLALGTGANTAIFSLIDAVMLRMLPVPRPEQLVFLDTNAVQSGSVRVSRTISLATLTKMNRLATTISGAGAYVVAPKFSVSVNGQNEVATPQFVAGAFFETLGVQPILGQTIRQEDTHASDRIAVLSYGYWQRRFGRDPGVIGRQIIVNRVPFIITGVLPPEFYGLAVDSPAEIFLPRATAKQVEAGQIGASEPEPRDAAGDVVARVKPDVSQRQVQAELSPLFRNTEMSLLSGDTAQRASLENRWIELRPASLGMSRVRNQFSQPLKVLMAVVGLVMLIACANIANLLLAKSTARSREIAIRLSLGSTRWRLIRQLLTESLLLSAAGGAVGMVFAVWARHGIVYLAGDPNIPLDWNPRVIAFTTGVMLLNALLFGVAPAFRGTGIDFAAALKSGRSGRGPGRLSFGRGIAVVQIALSLPLLVGAALFLETFRNLDRVDLGFARDRTLLAGIDPALAAYTGAGVQQVYGSILDRVTAIPGVRSASMIRYRLMGSMLFLTGVHIPGYTPKAGEDPANTWALLHEVGPRFFETSGMQLIAGRDFTERDNQLSPKVAVISESMARHYFGSDNPAGRQLFRDPKGPPIEIIGVARDVKYMHMRDQQQDAMFLPLMQDDPQKLGQRQHGGDTAVTLLVRTGGDPTALAPAVRAAIHGVDPNLPVLDMTTMDAQVLTSLTQQRLLAILSSFFGALALGLAAIGLYGVLSYGVSQRTGEIGIRMALGAQRAGILQMILRETAAMILLGAAAGLAISLAATRMIRSMLYHVTPTDPLSLTAAIGILGAVALVAGFLPARRASLVEPMTALRQE